MRRIFILLLTLIFFLMACNSDDSGGGILGLDAGPTAVVDLEKGEQVALTFLDAWTQQDYNTMYGLLTPNARDAYTQAVFTDDIYAKVWRDLALQEVRWIKKQVLAQGTTVLVQYDVTFISATLGEFTDPDRVMRLIPTNEGMRIAWSKMDIFNGWSEGSQLAVDPSMPNRGNIYDVQGRALADQNGTAVSIYLIKDRIPDEERCLDELKLLLGQEFDDLKAVFDRYNPDTRFLIGEIDPETLQRDGQYLQSVCRPVAMEERSTRRYFGTSAPHIVGFVGQIDADDLETYLSEGYKADALVGKTGVEADYEDQLRGNIGSRLTLVSLTGEVIRVIAERAPSPGQSVYLTIDRDLQRAIMQAFAEAYSLSEATWSNTSPGAAAVVLDVNTGAVLAMVSYPGFDPGVFNPDNMYLDPYSLISEYQTDPRRPMLNRATQARLPLGSVFKLISSVAGADSGLVPLTTVNVCSGTWYGEQYGDALPQRTDWDRDGHGALDGSGAIINSCNPYYWQLAVTLHQADPGLLSRYAEMLGFGQNSGILGVEEDPGYIPSPTLWRERGQTWGVADALNLVIGQGEVGVNPLQVARMVATIANGGTLYTPYLVREIGIIGEEPSFIHQPEGTALDLDTQALATIREAMCDVTTTPTGTANFIFEDWYDFQTNEPIICGKTGTAQSGSNPPHAWFASFAPADAPEIAVVVVVENSCEGSEVSAPISRRIYEIYYGLPQGEWPNLWQGGCTPLEVDFTY